MQFETPLFLLIGLLACVGLTWLYRRLQRSRQQMLQEFASTQLVERLTQSVSTRKRTAKFVFLVLATACLFAALARPQLGFRWEETHQKGIDILMAVDTSKSMLASDVQPNRLERAKLGILDFVSQLEGDRVGLIPFSGTAFLMCPLTLDYDAFRQTLETLDTTLMPRGGTSIATAIREAEAAFDKDANHRILVLITDGENLEGEALVAAEAAAQRGITIHTIGVGTPAGELIPQSVAARGTTFVKDEQGQVVKSRLDEQILKTIAQSTGGSYEPLGQRAEGLQAIYEEKLSLVPQEEFARRMRRLPLERFEWPLLLALLFLSVEYLLSDRKAVRRSTRDVVLTAGRRLIKRRKPVVAASWALLLITALPLLAEASPQSAEKADERGEFSAAEEPRQQALVQSPDDPRAAYNIGVVAYRGGDFEAAASGFEAVLANEDLALQSKGYYNLGNALYRGGQLTEESDPQLTILQWQEALTSYQGALAIDPDDEDARYNHDLVQRRLEELQEQNPPQQCEKPNKPQDSPEEGDENQDSSSQGGDSPSDSDSGEESDSTESSPQEEQEEQEGQKGEQESEQDSRAESPSGGGDEEREATGQEQQDRASSRGMEQEEQERPESPSSGGSSSDLEGEQGQDASGVGGDRLPGQMTPEQAESLLDSLEGEESELPFVPASEGSEGRRDDDPKRDW